MKIVALLIGAFVAVSLVWQAWSDYQFKSTGKRFTLDDGQALCARVLRLEAIQGYAGGGCEFGSSK